MSRASEWILKVPVEIKVVAPSAEVARHALHMVTCAVPERYSGGLLQVNTCIVDTKTTTVVEGEPCFYCERCEKYHVKSYMCSVEEDGNPGEYEQLCRQCAGLVVSRSDKRLSIHPL